MTILDLDALAALRPRAIELAARVQTGDVAACFDGAEFIAEVRALAAPAAELVDRLADTLDDRDLCDAFALVVDTISGVNIVGVAVDESRDRELYPDD